MAEQCARKSNENSDHGPGSSSVMTLAPREDVEMGNDEDEEPLEAEDPKAKMKPKNPTSQNMKIQDMLSAGIGVLWTTSN